MAVLLTFTAEYVVGGAVDGVVRRSNTALSPTATTADNSRKLLATLMTRA